MMLKKIRIPALTAVILLLLLSLLNMVLSPERTFAQSLTPTVTLTARPKRPRPTQSIVPRTLTPASATTTPARSKPTPIPLEAQAGHTDGLVVIGFLILAIIVVPVLLQSRNPLKKPPAK